MERFVIRLAAERASLSHRNQMLHIERVLTERRATVAIDEFNKLDRRIDTLILAAGGEPFLAHTMQPLHTIYRRIGFIYHRLMPGHADLTGSIDRHLAILNAVANRRVHVAVVVGEEFEDRLLRIGESVSHAVPLILIEIRQVQNRLQCSRPLNSRLRDSL